MISKSLSKKKISLELQSIICFLCILFIFKSPVIAILQIEFSLVLVLLVLVFTVLYLLMNLPDKFSSFEIVVLFAFSSLFLYALLQTIVLKVEIIFLIELVFLFLFFYIGYSLVSQKNYSQFWFLVVIVVVESIFLVLNRNFMLTSGQNYLLLSTPIVVAVIFLFFYHLESKNLMVVPLVVFVVYASFLLQSRFTFLFLIIFIFAYILFSRVTLSKILFCSFIAYLLYISLDNFDYQSLPVFKRLAIQGVESITRNEILTDYFLSMKNSYITGFGFSNTEDMFSNKLNKYPHNFILHLISEFGVVALPSIFIFIVIFFKSLWVYRKSEVRTKFIFTVYFFYLLVFLKSFSLYDAYPLFFFGGIAAMECLKQKRLKNEF